MLHLSSGSVPGGVLKYAPVSVCVLTKNEQANIAKCIAGLGFSDDIVILDSMSTDKTLEIARSYPDVRVFERPFDTEWKQRNYGLHEIQYKHPWVYICDADELVPQDLVQEIGNVIAGREEHVAYRLRFRNMFMGKWIKRSSGYPVWIIRLVRPQRVRYEQRATNVHPVVDGTTGELKAHFEHYSFSNGLAHWFAKHNFYSTREAIEGVRVRAEGFPSLKTLLKADPMQRRRALKNLSYFLAGRGPIRFLHSYVLRGGFLDGWAGLEYCRMIAMYEYWIEAKMLELEHPWAEMERRTIADLSAQEGL